MDCYAASVERDRAVQFKREQELNYIAGSAARREAAAEEARRSWHNDRNRERLIS